MGSSNLKPILHKENAMSHNDKYGAKQQAFTLQNRVSRTILTKYDFVKDLTC